MVIKQVGGLGQGKDPAGTPFGFWGTGLLVVAILLGIGLRFYHLGFKPPWFDEVYTLLWISGLSPEAVQAQVFNGLPLLPTQIATVLTPQGGTTVADTLHHLAQHDPQHPPLYYVGARWLGQALGSGVLGMRVMAALSGTLAIPAGYWLGRELWPRSGVGMMGAALIAVSPFHLLYAQDGRQFSLWFLVTLLSSAALLRAWRLNRREPWLGYGLTVILGFYTFPFFLFTVVAHGLYGWGQEGWAMGQRLRRWGGAVLVGLVAFAPWAWIMFQGLERAQTTTDWTNRAVSLASLVISWAVNTSRLFFDLNFDPSDPLIYSGPGIVLAGLLVIWAIYHTLRQASPATWWFVGLLIVTNALPLMGADVVLGGRRSTVARYLMPTAAGLHLIVAYGLAVHWRGGTRWRRTLGRALALGVLIAGLTSSWAAVQTETWWPQRRSGDNPAIAQLINQSPQPWVIAQVGELNFGQVLALSYSLQDPVTLQLFPEQQPLPWADLPTEGTVYVLGPTSELREEIVANAIGHLEETYPGGWVWQLIPNDQGG